MKIELYINLESHIFEVDEETSNFIKSHSEDEEKFEVFFPEEEFKTTTYIKNRNLEKA